MKNSRQITQDEKTAFDLLHSIRETGSINMLGAGAPLAEMMEIPKQEARKFLALWMANYREDKNYSIVIAV